MNTISLGYNNSYNYNNNTSSMDDLISMLGSVKLKKADMRIFTRAIEDYRMEVENMNDGVFIVEFMDKRTGMYKKIDEFWSVIEKEADYEDAYNAFRQLRTFIALRAMQLRIWNN